MPRFILAVLIAFGAALLQAQVAVTPYGYGTQGGALVPVAVPSPPLVFTPSIHLGEAPSTAYYANGLPATLPGAAYTEVARNSPSGEVVVAPPSGNKQSEAAFNFGVAQFSTYSTLGGQKTDLAAAARKLREEKSAAAAKTYTNSDIQRIQQEWGAPTANNSNLPNSTAPNAPPK